MGFQGSLRILTGTLVLWVPQKWISMFLQRGFQIHKAPRGAQGDDHGSLTFSSTLYFQERNVISENEKQQTENEPLTTKISSPPVSQTTKTTRSKASSGRSRIQGGSESREVQNLHSEKKS